MRFEEMSDRRWRMIWAGWIAYFTAAEYAALKGRNPKAPFSYFMRTTLGIQHSPLHHRAGQVVFGAGIVWLISHLYERGDR
ncbi:hypothetical protein [Streptomyces hydrogenans]|uniref:Uncharacterized protein n=1 Tax=Streptomyces hydrogenans TaxID=1873719 RepID=A0ABQ3PJG2_9ACTN|nr:hypothetical protein [Streptomyces hydrogenans]GHF94599.1 hypothetical protein GCM10018784_02830 [Streptomyces hydrogenans]GHI25157.1 hypothetical protein Shyd_65280 [Streptomyces hydrogenans]